MFPTEIFVSIFRNLPKSDIKNARLASSYVCGPATELLFDRVNISYRQKDLEVLEAVIGTDLVKYVKKIAFDVSSIDPPLTLERYTSDVDLHIINQQQSPSTASFYSQIRKGKFSRSNEGRNPGATDEVDLGDGYREYLQQSMVEAYIHQSGKVFECLRRAIGKMPALNCLTLFEDDDAIPHRFSPILQSRTPFLRAWNLMYPSPFSRDSQHDLTSQGEYTKVTKLAAIADTYYQLIRLVSKSPCRIKIMNVMYDCRENFFAVKELIEICPKYPTFFTNLRSMTLDMRHSRKVEISDMLGLRTLLSISASLTDLDIKFRPERYERLAQISTIFDSKTHLLSLRLLKLSNIEMTVMEFSFVSQQNRKDCASRRFILTYLTREECYRDAGVTILKRPKM